MNQNFLFDHFYRLIHREEDQSLFHSRQHGALFIKRCNYGIICTTLQRRNLNYEYFEKRNKCTNASTLYDIFEQFIYKNFTCAEIEIASVIEIDICNEIKIRQYLKNIVKIL